jgi:hypothetical protein
MFTNRATRLTLDACATDGLSAAGSFSGLAGTYNTSTTSGSGSSGSSGLLPSLERLDVDSSSLHHTQPFNLQPLGPLGHLQQLHITCPSTQQPGWQAAVSALSGLKVLCVTITGGRALDMGGVQGCVARLHQLQALALQHPDSRGSTPPLVAAHDLDLAPLAACTQLRRLTLSLQGRRLLGLTGLSGLVGLTSLHLGLTGWASPPAAPPPPRRHDRATAPGAQGATAGQAGARH